ncbi:MAG TPA: RimK family protein [Thermoanaerobaculia bacterium]|nr:RimK family protein [Thermoanaerobaculia bacterium]
MSVLIVINEPKSWPLAIPDVEVVAARAYLTEPRYSEVRGLKVFNLCRTYRYQSLGYYVSLLAAARGHRPLPSIGTIQDLKSQTIIRHVSDELDALIQTSLAPIQSERFVLSIYFGRNVAKRHERLARHLFNLFPAPLLRAYFKHGDTWVLQNIDPIPASEVPPEHRPFVDQAASEYFAGRRRIRPRRAASRYDLAILHNPDEPNPPSDDRALQKFVRAAQRVGFATELIERDDYGRIAEFDALFIRETTSVNHHTFRFARRAEAEGLVVIDDPDSIIKCTNKVYLAELLEHHKLPAPRTLIVHRDNLDEIVPALGLPIILKQPDSSFSEGVVKVESENLFLATTKHLLERSELVIAQEFLPTDFDWRVGVLGRRALYVCKYFMARHHWQIVKRGLSGRARYGQVESIPLDQVPEALLRTAVKAANLIGDGLYGVDLKQVGRRFSVIEINDNPSIEAGDEDNVLGDELYLRIMREFLRRVEARKQPGRGSE